MDKQNFIIIDPKDNCATALEDIDQHTTVDLSERKLTLNHDIPFGHKFALKDIKKGSNIIKYGEIIGFATEDIKIGDWMHIHNVASNILKVRNVE